MKRTVHELLDQIKEYFPDEWKDFPIDPLEVRKFIHKVSRNIDAETIEQILTEVGSDIMETIFGGKPKVSFVIDSNIIVADSFRVASGKASTTDRILSSPFLRLIAPSSIESEVYDQIKSDIPENCSLKIALLRAKELLSRVEIVDEKELDISSKELLLFKKKHGNDVHFLAIAMQQEVKGIISRDKRAFDDPIVNVKRFEMSDTVEIVVSTEAGFMTIIGLGLGIYAGAESLYWVFYFLYKAMLELFRVVASIASFGFLGIEKLLEITPTWVWYTLLIFIAGFGIAAVVSRDFRKLISNKVTDIFDWISKNSEDILNDILILVRGVIDMVEALKEQLGSYFFPLVWGLLTTLEDMQESLKK